MHGRWSMGGVARKASRGVAIALWMCGYGVTLQVLAHGAHPTDAHAVHAGLASAPGYVRTVAAYVVPNASLLDMAGAAYSLPRALDADGPVMLNFVFTTCTTVCPITSATFAQVQGALTGGYDKLRLISISIDPEHDTPARLRVYAAQFGAGPRWQFVTGSAEASIAVQRAFDVYRGDKMSHDPVTFIRAARGTQWIRLEGFASAVDLVNEYRRLVPR
jgi:protein SCO1/2